MSDNVLNPVDLEAKIQEIARRIHDGVKVVTAAERDAREKRRLYDHAYAKAYMAHSGAAHEKKYAAEMATTEDRAAAEASRLASVIGCPHCRDRGDLDRFLSRCEDAALPDGPGGAA